MSRASRRGIIAKPQGITYADWVARAAVLAPTTLDWLYNDAPGSGTYKTVCSTNNQAGLIGTTFNNNAGAGSGSSGISYPAGMIRHAMPTQAIHDDNRTNARVVVSTINTQAVAIGWQFEGVTRYGSVGTNLTVDEAGTFRMLITNFKYWDEVAKKVRQWDPSQNGPITDYVWP